MPAPPALSGLAVAIVWSYWRELFGTTAQPTITLAIAVPCLTSVAIAAILGRVVEKDDDFPGRAYTWRSIMRRPVPQTVPEDSPRPAGGPEPTTDETVPSTI